MALRKEQASIDLMTTCQDSKVSKMRVLHLIKGLGRGGAEMLLKETLIVHNREEFDFIYIYFLPQKSHLAIEIEAAGGGVICMGTASTWSMLRSVFRLRKLIEDIRPDIIHAHLPISGVLARVVGRSLRIPVVYTEHYNPNLYNRITKWLNKLTYDAQDAVIAVSDETAYAIRSATKFKGRLCTIRNGVNTEFYKRSADLSSGNLLPEQAKGKTIITTTAVFRRQKRLDLWLKIAGALLAKEDNFFFVILGDGPERAALAELVDQLDIADSVHCPGLVVNTRDYLAVTDIYLMTSFHEGLPVALLEAMSMQCTPVVTPVGGISTLIQDGENGKFINAEDIEDSSDTIRAISNDRAALERIGTKARNTIVKDYSMQRMVGEIESLYRRVLKR